MIRPELDTAVSDSPATKATASFPSFLIIFATCCDDLGNTKDTKDCSKRRGDDKDHLEISRWPIEKNSDNPFFVFCFTLAVVPLRKKSEEYNNFCSYLTANRPKHFHIFWQGDQFPSLPEDARVTKTVSCL